VRGGGGEGGGARARAREAAEKLATASRADDFADQLDELLDGLVVEVAEYPALADIAWNRTARFISARDAFSLYERNWRFVDRGGLTERERALIDRLARRYGGGIIHA